MEPTDSPLTNRRQIGTPLTGLHVSGVQAKLLSLECNLHVVHAVILALDGPRPAR